MREILILFSVYLQRVEVFRHLAKIDDFAKSH
jgi:hypothetical protein